MSNTPGFSVDLGSEKLDVTGWDEIDGIAKDNRGKILQDQVDHATLYRQCFSSSAGRYVLDDLIQQFFKQDIILESDPPGSLAPGIRQGQASIVKRILYMIEFANTGGGKPTGSGVPTEE